MEPWLSTEPLSAASCSIRSAVTAVVEPGRSAGARVRVQCTEVEKPAGECPAIPPDAIWQFEPANIGVEEIDLGLVDDHLASAREAATGRVVRQSVGGCGERESKQSAASLARDGDHYRRRQKPITEPSCSDR